MHCTSQADTNKCFAFKSATKLKSWGMSRRLTDVTMAAWLNGYGVGSLVLWGRVFTFSLKIPSFNFDIDSIYGLEATQHAQFQVEVETKLIFYGRILWGFMLCFKLCFSIVSGKAKKGHNAMHRTSKGLLHWKMLEARVVIHGNERNPLLIRYGFLVSMSWGTHSRHVERHGHLLWAYAYRAGSWRNG